MIRLGTILVPAWNEAAVIGRTLGRLQSEGATRFFHVIVIANACSDDTAAVARAAMPAALVIETPVPGKTHALNLGHAEALAGLPIVCLDADLSTGVADLIALTAPLRNGRALAACGTMQVDSAASSTLVRAWYRAWALNPYFAQGKFGGLFALSAKAADRLFPLPAVTADDEYLRRAIAPGQIAFVPSCRFVARAPRDLDTLLRVRQRSLRGSRALRRPSGHDGAKGMLRTALRHPARWADVAVFIAVQMAVRLNLARETAAAPGWERDLTTRTSA
jgi:glycosyltransferase involved in cell wall biosynthesis